MATTGFWNRLMRALGLGESASERPQAPVEDAPAPPPGEARADADMSGAVADKTGGTVAQDNPTARKTGTAQSKAKAKSASKTPRKSGKSGKSRDAT